MLQLGIETLRACRVFSERKLRGQTLTQHELDLYEATSKLALTIVAFHNLTSQSAIIKAERDLNDCAKQEGEINEINT